MGILPLQFKEGFNRKKLNIKGAELFTIIDIEKELIPEQKLTARLSMTMAQVKLLNFCQE